jgi:hypothetical protein
VKKDGNKRKGWSMAEAERWLAPILCYEPRHLPPSRRLDGTLPTLTDAGAPNARAVLNDAKGLERVAPGPLVFASIDRLWF